MIRHLVFFSVERPEDVAVVVETLNGYRDIPSVRSLEVARNDKLDDADREIDVVLHVTFDDRDALNAYKRHPAYLAGIDVIRPRRRLRYVVDYEVDVAADP